MNRDLQAILREDLTAFTEKVFETVSPGDEYVDNWHVSAITYRLGQCLTGETRRLLITQPPRSLKSICTSVAFVAWALGRDPSQKFICVSYSQDLALDLARQFRLVVESDWYQDLYPGMRLKKNAEADFVTTKAGGRLATSIGGTLTGRGADYIVIDDPLKAEEAQSETTRKRVIECYSGTLSTRLNDKRKGVIIVVMQRLHEDDLAGHLSLTSQFKHLDLPAIAIEDERVAVGPGRFHMRREGEALQPKRESLETLQQIKTDLGSLKFSAQYQQRPIPTEGNLVKRAWFGQYSKVPTGPGVETIQSWDTASSAKDTADYSVCVTAVLHNKQLYITDVWRGRLTYPDLKRKVVGHAVDMGTGIVLIEKAASGMHLVDELRREQDARMPRPIGILPDTDKVVRMEAASAMIERGDVYMPAEADWLDVFLVELLAFPRGRNDDQVDALSQLINWIKKRPPMIGYHGIVPAGEVIHLDY